MISSEINEFIESNKKSIITFLTEILNIKIFDINFCEVIKYNCPIQEDFFLYKFNIKNEKNEEIDVYIKKIKENRIKQSIYCYWTQLYENYLRKDNNKNYCESIINKVMIREKLVSRKQKRVFLGIENNSTNILKNGTEIILLKMSEYKQKNKIKKMIQFNENEILLIGVVLPDNVFST